MNAIVCPAHTRGSTIKQRDDVSHVRQVANARIAFRVGNTGAVLARVREHVIEVWGRARTDTLNRVAWEYDRTLPLMSDDEIAAVTDMTLVKMLGSHLGSCETCWRVGGLPSKTAAAVLSRIVLRHPAGALLAPIVADCEAAEKAGHRLPGGGAYPPKRSHGRHVLLEVGTGKTDAWRDSMLKKRARGLL